MSKFENVEVIERRGKLGMFEKNQLLEPTTDFSEIQFWISKFEPDDEYLVAEVDLVIEDEITDKPISRRAYVLYIDFKKNSLFNPKRKGN